MNQRSKFGGDRVYRVAAADGEVREGAARRQLGGEARGLLGGKAPGRRLIAADRCQGAAAAAWGWFLVAPGGYRQRYFWPTMNEEQLQVYNLAKQIIPSMKRRGAAMHSGLARDCAAWKLALDYIGWTNPLGKLVPFSCANYV
eukprot:COSAG02_NODE_12997_length_1462_cov_103.550990_2_plen_143_part_00